MFHLVPKKFGMISICHTIMQVSNQRIHYWNSNCSSLIWLIIFTWYIVSKSTPTFCDTWYWWAYTDWSSHINWKLKSKFEFFCYVIFYFLQVLEDLVDHMVCLVDILISSLKLCNKGFYWLQPVTQNRKGNQRIKSTTSCVQTLCFEDNFLFRDHVFLISRSRSSRKSS